MTQSPEPERATHRPNLASMIIFALVLGAVAPLLKGYSFGAGDQIEQLPQVLRLLDPSFAPRDPFVNGAELFSPRLYYCHALAALAHLMPLWLVALLGAVLCNAAVALITWYATRDLLGASHRAGLLACVVAMSVRTIGPGGQADLFYVELIPAAMAQPLALLSLWAALRLRPFAAAGAAALAGLMHPVLGIVTGLIALAAAGLWALWSAARSSGDDRRQAVGLLARVAGAMLTLGLFVALVWGRGYEETLSGREIANILSHFRHPHHDLPGSFPLKLHAANVAFLIALVISWLWHRRRADDRALADRLIVPVAMVALMLVGGYLFVEVIPTRAWVTIRAFRFLFIPKWLGIMLFAATVHRLWRTREPGQPVVAWVMLLAHGPLHGALMLWAHLVEMVRRRLPVRAIGVALTPAALVAVAVTVRWPAPAELVALVLLGLAGLPLVASPSRALRLVAPPAVLGLVCALTLVRPAPDAAPLSALLGVRPPTFTMAASNPEIAGVSEFARAHTPPDALFLVPPNMGAFRIMAYRALVVDFKTFPFGDQEMVDWRRRIEDCYGPTTAGGFRASAQMDEGYQRISDEHLRWLAARYGVDHAVLYTRTDTRLPVLYSDEVYKIVNVPGGHGPEGA